jgi:hypothetical protein
MNRQPGEILSLAQHLASLPSQLVTIPSRGELRAFAPGWRLTRPAGNDTNRAMRSALSSLVISVLCASLGACGTSGKNNSFDLGDGGGSGSGGSGSSSGGSSSGGSSGSSSGGSSGSSSSGGSSGSSSSGSSSGSCTTDTGPITGTVGNTGGSVSRLVFAVVGDTRPANEDDPSGYPTSVITKIFQDIEAQSPHPVLTLGTGDYQFSVRQRHRRVGADLALHAGSPDLHGSRSSPRWATTSAGCRPGAPRRTTTTAALATRRYRDGELQRLHRAGCCAHLADATPTTRSTSARATTRGPRSS